MNHTKAPSGAFFSKFYFLEKALRLTLNHLFPLFLFLIS